MSDYFLRVAIATVRFFGISYGAFLLLFSPFAFSGALASEAVDPPSFAASFIAGLTMVWVGATLVIPFRAVVARPVWTRLLFVTYAVSAGLLVTEGASIGDGGLRVVLWQILLVALNAAGLLYVRRSENPYGA